MKPKNENPATACSGAGLPNIVQLGGFERNQDSRKSPDDQPWNAAREYERHSIGLARSALLMRGGDRLQSLAVASAMAIAARDAAVIAGAMQ